MVEYHEVKEEYFDELAELISEKWATPDIRDNPVAMKHNGLSSLFFFMVHHSYTCVAVDNGKVIGLLVCTDVKDRPFDMKYAKLLIKELAYTMCNPDTRDNGMEWGRYTKLAKALEEKVASGYEAELELFIVAPEYRGQGIGTRMFKSMIEFFRMAGIKDFFLHTDTACTYQFYDNIGLKRIGSMSSDISSADVENIELYVYGGKTADFE